MFHDTKMPEENVILTRDPLNKPRRVRCEGHVAHVVEIVETFRFEPENLEGVPFLRGLRVRIILILITEK
jgi:hypothetical protein